MGGFICKKKRKWISVYMRIKEPLLLCFLKISGTKKEEKNGPMVTPFFSTLGGGGEGGARCLVFCSFFVSFFLLS